MILNILIFAAIGIVAGFLSGRIFRGAGFGLIGNLIVGIAGSFLGGWLFNILGLRLPFRLDPIISSIITATAGAILLLFIINIVKKR